MMDKELVEILKRDDRLIIRSVSLMFEHRLGFELCEPLLQLVREHTRERKIIPGVVDVYAAQVIQFSLEVGLFNLMHNNIEPAIVMLKMSADAGNFLAGVTLWVIDMRLDRNHLSETKEHDLVWNVICSNTCGSAFEPVLETVGRTLALRHCRSILITPQFIDLASAKVNSIKSLS